MAKILICTGIYPPQIGGPAQYAKEIREEFEKRGNIVKVLTYGLEHRLPPIIRHELFFWRTLCSLRGVDFIFALDTFSVGWPAVVAARFFNKKIIVRTGGDFLWESYVERTGDLVLLKNFYKENFLKLNWKEKIIFSITKWTLQNMSAVIFSTHWQKEIFEQAYELDAKKNFVVENFYGEKKTKNNERERVFVAGTRPLKWKNLPKLTEAFVQAQKVDSSIALDTSNAPYGEFFEKISSSYAVILVSLGDISPNMVLDAIRTNTPFILTQENGLMPRIKDIGIFVDPENVEDIKEKILFLSDEANYRAQQQKVAAFNFIHSWADITDEILAIVKNIHESH